MRPPGPQLAAHLGVDVRTLRRDVESLRRLGIPIEAERGPAGGYRLRPGYRMPPLMFTTTEAIAVALGLLAARRDGLDADGALAKLHRVLPERVRLRVEALEHTLQHQRPAAPAAAARRRDAARARRGRLARPADPGDATPTAAARETERELSPYGLVAHAGRWYVPAYDHGRGEPRALRADRVP